MCLLLLCTYAKERKQDEAPEKMTKTKLYTEVHERLMDTYLKHHYESPEERKRKRCEIKESLQKLAFLAEKTCKFVFTLDELLTCNLTPQSDVIRIGILTSCYEYDADTRHEYSLYQFVHKSFYDYWYASYLSENKTPEEQMKEWKREFALGNWCVFLYGLNGSNRA